MIKNQKKTDWKPAIEIFSKVSVWIVAPIILALVVGKSLDAHYGTKPIIFLILAGLGFLFSCFGIVRVIRKYVKDIKELASPYSKTTADEEKNKL